jgi:hypothetical protein
MPVFAGDPERVASAVANAPEGGSGIDSVRSPQPATTAARASAAMIGSANLTGLSVEAGQLPISRTSRAKLWAWMSLSACP